MSNIATSGRKYSVIIIFITAIIVLGVSIDKRWKGKDGQAWTSIINADGYGYYAYLPCAFIYHSFDYNSYINDMHAIRPSAPIAEISRLFPPSENNRPCDKCFIGVSLVLLPFFLLAYFLSFLLGYDLNGVSCLFQLSVSLAAMVYLILGLIYLKKLLKLYSLPEIGISVTLFIIVFSTNLFYYAVFEPSLSHVYGFGITSIFLYFVKKYSINYHTKFATRMAVTLGILILLRPTNILSVLFIPFICGSFSGFKEFIRNLFANWRNLALIVLLAAILTLQPITWYIQTGKFLVKSYPGEGFDFAHPHFFDILFSYKKGWFIYTPIMLVIIIAGVVVLGRRNKFLLFWFMVFTIAITYIFSSWSDWSFGGSFGHRAFIDFYAEFGLVVGLTISALKTNLNMLVLIIAGALSTFLNLFQTDQYFNFILSPDCMNKSRYWQVFLKRDNYYVGIYNFPDTTAFNMVTGFSDMNNDTIQVNKNNQSHEIYSCEAGKLPKQTPLDLMVNMQMYLPDYSNRIALKVDIQSNKGGNYFEQKLPLLGYVSEQRKWSYVYSTIELPGFNDSTDILNVYVENSLSEFTITDTKIRYATPK